MKNRIIVCGIALCLLAGAGVSAMRAQDNAKVKPEEAKEVVVVEKTGIVTGKRMTYENVEYVFFSLTVGKESFALHYKNYDETWKLLGGHEGKTLTVTGELRPAKPPKYPIPGITITSIKFPGGKPGKPGPPPPGPPAKK